MRKEYKILLAASLLANFGSGLIGPFYAIYINEVGIGLLGVSFAFGLTVLTMAFAIGHISGCHLNPAVSIGLWMGGRFNGSELLGYIVAQVLGGIAGAGVLWTIASGNGADLGGFAANGFGELSPGGYSMLSGFITEVVMTFFFLLIPLVLVAWGYGRRGAVWGSTWAAILHLGTGCWALQQDILTRSFFSGVLMRIALLYLVPLLVSILAQRERKQHAQLETAHQRLRRHAAVNQC